MNVRVLIVAGAVAGLSLISAVANAEPGINSGGCGAAYSPSGTIVNNPATGGQYYTNQSGGATGGAAGAGAQGTPGFVEANATGTAAPPAGSATVEGNQAQSGVNSKVVASGTPSVCAGSTVAGKGVNS